MDISWVGADELQSTAQSRLRGTGVVLDIGCGIRPQDFIQPAVHICCEPFDQYIEKLMESQQPSDDTQYVFVRATWEEAIRLFPEKSVDTVFLNDVIEHLYKEDGERLLRATEKLARHQIAVFTPLGFLPQEHPDGKDGWGLDGGSWQEHKSGWVPEDFGPDWDFVACKDFHRVDSTGEPFETPYGAFWAIRTYPQPSALADHSPSSRGPTLIRRWLGALWSRRA